MAKSTKESQSASPQVLFEQAVALHKQGDWKKAVDAADRKPLLLGFNQNGKNETETRAYSAVAVGVVMLEHRD